MKDLLKKTMFMGLGLASMTKDKLKSVTDELVEMGKLSEEEGEKLYGELQEESKKAKNDLNAKVEDLVKKSMNKLPCSSMWNEISERIARIEKALDIETPKCCGGDCSCQTETDDKE